MHKLAAVALLVLMCSSGARAQMPVTYSSCAEWNKVSSAGRILWSADGHIKAICPQFSPAQDKVTDQSHARLMLALKGHEQAFPKDWHIVLAGENTWKSAQAQSRISESAFTVLKEHKTYVREKYVTEAGILELRHVLFHEAGHATCQCFDENIAESFANSGAH